jgi:hypothetical protein
MVQRGGKPTDCQQEFDVIGVPLDGAERGCALAGSGGMDVIYMFQHIEGESVGGSGVDTYVRAEEEERAIALKKSIGVFFPELSERTRRRPPASTEELLIDQEDLGEVQDAGTGPLLDTAHRRESSAGDSASSTTDPGDVECGVHVNVSVIERSGYETRRRKLAEEGTGKGTGDVVGATAPGRRNLQQLQGHPKRTRKVNELREDCRKMGCIDGYSKMAKGELQRALVAHLPKMKVAALAAACREKGLEGEGTRSRHGRGARPARKAELVRILAAYYAENT